MLAFTFEDFVIGNFDYSKETRTHSCLWLREENMNIGGGRISARDIDMMENYPDTDTVTISGLRQDTFEYFISKYGKQLKAIRFFKNKFIEDLSPLSDLTNLIYVYFFANQRVTSLWNMSRNHSLTSVGIDDFSRLHMIDSVNTAPALEEFQIGNAIWSTMCIESFLPLADTNIKRLSFTGKSINDNDFSFLERMSTLEQFDFSLNLLSTEQVAWIVANFPHLKGYSLRAKVDCELYKSNSELRKVPGTIIVGKRKPALIIEGNENRIEKYIRHFEELKIKYKGLPYGSIFPK